MADNTPIEWTDATWNPITGCSVVSPGCTHCYAMKLAGGRLRHHPSRAGLTTPSKAGPVWNGQVRFNEAELLKPLSWTRPRRIFVCAHGDLFHAAAPDAWIDRVFAVMALCPQHTFQVLTKRPERMRAYVQSLAQTRALGPIASEFVRENKLKGRSFTATWPLPNVWLGVSVEDQTRADERIPELLATPAAVRWISAEPLIAPVDLTRVRLSERVHVNVLRGRYFESGVPYIGEWDVDGPCPERPPSRLDWVIAGGESGPGARPMHPGWARQLRDQCAAAGVAFLFKQWGNWTPGENAGPIKGPQVGATWFDERWVIDNYTRAGAEALTADDGPDLWCVGKKAAGRHLDGVIHDGFPTPSTSRCTGDILPERENADVH